MMANPVRTATHEKVEFLSRPDAWPECPHSVEVIETHMSWVFLTDTQAYKLKKPVALPFLDFTSLAARKRDSYAEVRLNRRLARDVYLEVQTLVARDDGRLCLEGHGEVVDYIVHMRRLPRGRMLDQLVLGNGLRTPDLKRAALLLTDFYQRATPINISANRYQRRLLEDAEANCRALLAPEYDLPVQTIERILDLQHEFLAENKPLLSSRAHHVIEAHGDLRPEHVCLTEPPVIIDCLEFNRAFRLLDPVDELAFFGVECDLIDAAAAAQLLMETYTERLGDTVPAGLVAFHKSCRACLRAKLSAWHLRDDPLQHRNNWRQKTRDYLALAEHYANQCVG